MLKLTEAFNKAVVEKGEIFYIELPENPSTGYGWEFSVNSGILKVFELAQDFKSSASKEDMICGAGGHRRLVLQASERMTGNVEIQAEYKRPWETNEPPAKVVKFNITVN